jgi:hypothetical protein
VAPGVSAVVAVSMSWMISAFRILSTSFSSSLALFFEAASTLIYPDWIHFSLGRRQLVRIDFHRARGPHNPPWKVGRVRELACLVTLARGHGDRDSWTSLDRGAAFSDRPGVRPGLFFTP